MRSYHKMIVALAVVGLLAFGTWTEFTTRMSGVDVDSDEPALLLPEPSMNGPRGAIPATQPGTWMRSQDYPRIALDGDIEGITKFRVVVSQFGEVAKCEITKPSGYLEFDERVCNAISTRAKFYPALNKDDHPVEGSYSSTVVWVLED